MKRILIDGMLLSVLFISTCLLGQTSKKNRIVNPLQIGQFMPDVTIEGLRNYPKPKVRFSEFHNKLVILDFWMGRCPGCIEAFPKMESLQQRFGKDIQIIMVNFESQSLIDSNFHKWSRVSSIFRNPHLPSLTSDQLFHRLFSVQSYPHEVWIDGDGKVIAFTGTEEVNENNISRVLQHLPLHIDMKRDIKKFQANKVSFIEDIYPDFPDKLRYYSAFFSYIPGIGSSDWNSIIDTSRQSLRITRQNYTVFDLFAEAALKQFGAKPFSNPRFDFGKRVILNVSDSNYCFYSPETGLTKGEWRGKYCYTYESVLPLSGKNRMYQVMMEDLQRNFRYDCYLDKRNLKCWALIRTSENDKIHSTKPALSLFDPQRDTSKFQMYSGTLNLFVQNVAQILKQTPYLFADASQYAGYADIELDLKDISSIDSLNKALKKYDLQFVEKILPMEVLVFTEHD